MWPNTSSFLFQSTLFPFTYYHLPSPTLPRRSVPNERSTPPHVHYIARPAPPGHLPSTLKFQHELPIPGSYKEPPSPLVLHHNNSKAPLLYVAFDGPCPSLFLLKSSTSPSQRRPFPRDTKMGSSHPLPPSSSWRGPTSHKAVSVARRRDHALPLPLVHGEPPHAQSIELWTRSTPIFKRKINLSKLIPHHFAQRPSSFMKIKLWHLLYSSFTLSSFSRIKS
jgi:hypothetical protein